MEIVFEPKETTDGTMSFASWENDDLKEALRRVFNETYSEELTRVEVTRKGLRALFKKRD